MSNSQAYYRRLSAAGTSALSIWELRANKADVQRLLGDGVRLEPGRVALTRRSFAFDEALCWCRQVCADESSACVVELHLHGGFGVAASLRELLHQEGWIEVDHSTTEGKNDVGSAGEHDLLQATSPLAARVFAARRQQAWNLNLQRLRDLPKAQRESQVADLRGWNEWGRILAQPPSLLIAGPPNAGKSTLFNAWLQERRVTANEAAGTTRDLVSASLQLGQGAEAFMVELTDSAGVWQEAQGVDQAAVRMTEQALASAWRVIWVFDAAAAPSGQVLDAVDRRSAQDLLVVNRCDRPAAWQAESVLPRPFLRGEPSNQTELLAALEQQLLGQLGPVPAVGQLMAISQAERAALEAL